MIGNLAMKPNAEILAHSLTCFVPCILKTLFQEGFGYVKCFALICILQQSMKTNLQIC